MEIAVAIIFMAFLAIVGVFDLYAILSRNGTETVSHVIYRWAKQWPIIPFLAGMIVGHLFFPTVVRHQ